MNHIVRRFGCAWFGLVLALCAPPTLAENPAEVKPETVQDHLALLLPLNTAAFRQPAEAVKLGFLAAAKAQAGGPEVRIYPTGDQPAHILSVYYQALAAGAKVIVGPLTKNAVALLNETNMVAVPTIALSVPDTDINSANLYLFGLSLEAEAREVAQMALSEGRHSMLVIHVNSLLGKRLQVAFADEWRRLGGQTLAPIGFSSSAELNQLRDKVQKLQPPAIFLAMNVAEARMVRPYLSNSIPTYASSQAFGGKAEIQRNIDLNGVRFLDMPWLLQPDHPAVMIYTRPGVPLTIDGERLYAMGIDAYRLALLFYRGLMPTRGAVLDGVTGQITLDGRQFNRELTAAEFQADVIVVLDSGKP